ncbi:MAG: hypothetical protein M3Y65_08825 [Pseudomonadota bacterium]|nr:hypothetical protein [Pseudomonadota bacterium]
MNKRHFVDVLQVSGNVVDYLFKMLFFAVFSLREAYLIHEHRKRAGCCGFAISIVTERLSSQGNTTM